MDGDTPLSELTQTVAHGSPVNRPPDPTKDGFGFVNWYSDSELTVLYDFDSPVTGGFTIHVKWIIIITNVAITNVADIEAYLAEHPANTADNPVTLRLMLDLGTMINAGSNWRLLLGDLETAGKYVDLDLSACTIQNGASTIFNPDYNVATGKDKIVEIALPDTAGSVPVGNSANPTFKHFTVLESFSGKGLTSIDGGAFYGCTSLAQTSLPAGLTSIGANAFQNCTNLALTSLPEGLTAIKSGAFNGCTSLALTSLPAGLTSIEANVFQNCANLALISLHAGLTAIKSGAFNGCTSLTNVTCLAATPPTLGGNVFNSTNAGLRIEVPAESVAAYKANSTWKTYADRIFAIDG
jgi:hypothetical protein